MVRIKLNKIDDGYVTVTFNSTELVDICNSLYRDKDRNNETNILYADLMMVRDLSQYGNIDDFSFTEIMKQRGYLNEE